MNSYPFMPRWWGLLVVGLTGLIIGTDWVISPPRQTWWNTLLSLLWSLSAPVVIVALYGGWRYLMCQHRWRYREHPRPGAPPGTINLIYQIPTIGRADVWPGLSRVINSCHASTEPSVNVAIWVITEPHAEILSQLDQTYGADPQVRVIVVPRDYFPPNGSRFKARANAYADWLRQQERLNTPETWIYHLDDDTSVTPYSQAVVQDFITQRRNPYTLAQGLLTFPYDYAQHRWSWMADAVRPTDDITRFFVFTGLWHRPWVGLHGENLLVRADRETAIGWDFGPTVITEDAYFGVAFARQFPGEATFLPMYTAGASPDGAQAFWTQRGRWFEGLWRMVRDPSIPWRYKGILAVYVGLWVTAWMQNVLLILPVAYVGGWDNTSPIAHSIVLIWGLIYSFWASAYITGYRINILVSRTRPRWPIQFRDMALLLVALPLVQLYELRGIWDGMHRLLRRAPVQFFVISKSQ